MEQDKVPKILLFGTSGAGKTTLYRTIPGRKFVYMFDPAGLNSIMPEDDIFYEKFLVEDMSLAISTLKGVKDSKAFNADEMDVYTKWENDFQTRCDKNFWSDPEVEIDGCKGGFDVIIFDSLTTLSDLVFDRILQINMRAGKTPEISDYGILAGTLARIVRKSTATGKTIVWTAHEQANQDKLMRTISMDIMVTGQLKSKLPLLFSDIYHCTANMDEKTQKPAFKICTTPEDLYKISRASTAMRDAGLGLYQDVTLQKGRKADEQGLAPFINKIKGL
jgi:GTPase SAR1 family protein